MKILNLAACAFCVLLLHGALTGLANAAPLPAIVSISNPPGGANGRFTNTYGWRFRAEQNVNVTALGFADIGGIANFPASNGLRFDHSVILWDSLGTNLAEATLQQGFGSAVGPGTINLSQPGGTGVFRYETLAAPISLSAGSMYTISAFFPAFSFPSVFDGPPAAVTVYDNRITPLGLSFLSSASHVFPTGISGPFRSIAGPTFLIDSSVAAVPLPAAFPLLAGGLGLMGLIGWRRKRKAGQAA